MTEEQLGGLVRPDVSVTDAATIARECYGIEAVASELGSNQDRNFVLRESDGSRSVLRVDNPVFTDAAREAQHAALVAYRAAGVPVASVIPGLDGAETQRWGGFAVRRSEFAPGSPMVDLGYFAPVVLEEFGALAAASVRALADLTHPGLASEHMWVMAVAYEQTVALASAIADEELRTRVLAAAEQANAALAEVAAELPTQAIHGDLTDDNVTGLLGDDSRVHPHTVLDLGDLAYGWRVSELAVTASSMLHHEPERPLRLLDLISAFHREAPLSIAEARAVWPLIVLRATILVASGWRQLEIDGDNDYARDRVAGEQAIFDAATAVPLAEATEQVLARLGFQGVPAGSGLQLIAAPGVGIERSAAAPLRALLPDLSGEVSVLDPGVESEAFNAGAWRADDAEATLVSAAFAAGAAAAVFPYGVYRLTRTTVDTAEAGATWPVDTELWLPAGAPAAVATPVSGRVASVGSDYLRIEASSGWTLVLHGLTPALQVGTELGAGDSIGVLAEASAPRSLAVGLRRKDAGEPDSGAAVGVAFVAPDRVPAWARFSHDPADLLGLPRLAQRDESSDELARREEIFASAQERYYERPMQIERGWRHHLVDTTGRAYIDMVNNVTGLGHGHPGVADAVNRQIRVLNTNSRFLFRELAEYSERLLALLPEGSELDTVLLVNSGSEAVDLALRLAQAATGRRTVVSLREAYHGWTMASDAVTTSAYDNPFAAETRPDWVHVADVPNQFRGTYRGSGSGARYASDLGADLALLAAEGREVAGFICESVLGNAGGVMLPDGYLADAYQRVRAAGGLCIADEVQVGFGRMGTSFWGFEQSGVRPDIIAIAKPMGNGFPIGGVITSKKVADALASQGQFFSSAGGNPLSCAVGIAVLDAMRDEALQENARVVGARLADGFRRLAETHAIIGPVHGEGLYLGVELVRDRETMEPATEEAAAICERLRELGIVVLTTSERSNVLKVKPPLCLTGESADVVVAALDRVLTEGW
ncbi:hydroxylysine kinase /5-phosphonooxy-L-lysine phospho-lyase [Leucobacter luti]|uniref:aminotransferase n=1 Tax=Leucobacter luti TaxID=340320 RepID=UPI001045ED8D|nr:aminotransferase [Leucobacter luti]MCW2288055.1 4-aminobutyrate aminotransferase-like enzyme/Ser/Thr protein kinase RdoA (MazF antagonist) [Leucobacter luti]TCK45783.1 hydroxylysine kinase /5-phosphonooxy-L-lysine phospho-lyase [Leucobacter luti]